VKAGSRRAARLRRRGTARVNGSRSAASRSTLASGVVLEAGAVEHLVLLLGQPETDRAVLTLENLPGRMPFVGRAAGYRKWRCLMSDSALGAQRASCAILHVLVRYRNGA
jgi:hypothetical protein